MNVTRRDFLQFAGAATCLSLSGCNRSSLRFLPGFQEPLVDSGTTATPWSTETDTVTHILTRTSYGLRYKDYARVAVLAPKTDTAIERYLDEQLNPDKINDEALEHTVRRLEVLNGAPGELYEYKEDLLLETLVRGTLLRAVYSQRQLYEVMVQFWTDHFNIDSSKGECKWLKIADDRDVIRRHALGSFNELLRASALSPAMLWYLDGRVNQKQTDQDKPNENYARELLELHTLGIHGGYTQKDVMEVARCLTGWTVRDRSRFYKGKVEFERERHDDGAKTILGREIEAGEGARDLDHVLTIVAGHPSTALHIATKLCRRFMCDEPSPAACARVADAFKASGGDIRSTLRTLFTSPEFFASKGAKFRRPFEFLVAALRSTNAETDGGRPIIDYLDRMGHSPFHYPTPDGYSARAAPWLNTLLWRWNFAVALTEKRIPGTKVDVARLKTNCGGEDGLMASVFGRLATPEEKLAYSRSPNGMALLLASPAFQYS